MPGGETGLSETWSASTQERKAPNLCFSFVFVSPVPTREVFLPDAQGRKRKKGEECTLENKHREKKGGVIFRSEAVKLKEL